MSATDLRRRLQDRYPSRRRFVASVCDLYADRQQPLPPFVYVRSINGDTKRSLGLVQSVISSVDNTVAAVINPLCCPDIRHAFRRINLALSRRTSRPTEDDGEITDAQRISSMMPTEEDSTNALCDRLRSNILDQGSTVRLVVIVPHAEKLRDVWNESSVASLLDLSEKTALHGQISVLTLSALSSDHIFPSFGAGSRSHPITHAIQIAEEQPDRASMLEQIERDVAEWWHASPEYQEGGQPSANSRQHSALLSSFVQLAYDTFGGQLKGREEMGELVYRSWNDFIGSASDERGTAAELRRAISLLRKEYRTGSPSVPGHLTTLHIFTGTLLLSSFLASYSPPRADVQLFVREEYGAIASRTGKDGDGGKQAKRKKGGAIKKRRLIRRAPRHGQTSETVFALRPRSFALDRLLSIHSSVLLQIGLSKDKSGRSATEAERCATNVNTLGCINHLLRMGYLVRTTTSDRLDVNTTLRTNVMMEDALGLARRLQLDLGQYFFIE